MFTGIITDIGEVLSVAERNDGLRRLSIGCGYDGNSIALGASIACAGVCLTVVEIGKVGGRTTFSVDVAAETLAVTTVGRWRQGMPINLERALKIGDELGGHLVSGHVDAIGEVVAREDKPDMARLKIRVPQKLARFIAVKGSIAIDGTSLTVNVVDGDTFFVLIIPHTLTATTLGRLRSGDMVNIEVDQMARYAARLMERG